MEVQNVIPRENITIGDDNAFWEPVGDVMPWLDAKSFRPVFLVDGKWYGNGERHKTVREAALSASGRFMAWTMPTSWGVAPSDEEPNR